MVTLLLPRRRKDRAAGRIYHVADAENLTEAAWVRRIAEEAGWHGEVVTLSEERMPQHLKHEHDTAQDWSVDSTRIRTELGY
ncbi:MAG: hypothetical protein ROW52_08420, partial [Anaerolineaceae bacterium]